MFTKRVIMFQNKIYQMNDFPVFKYWNFNDKVFEDRELNKLSIRFLNSLATYISKVAKNGGSIEDLQEEFVDSVKYAYYFNASYEAAGPNSYGGGDDSIQEQFVCWALDCPLQDYRDGKYCGLELAIQESEVIRNWLENSELYKLFLKERKKYKEKL